jgi:hypothetical protein
VREHLRHRAALVDPVWPEDRRARGARRPHRRSARSRPRRPRSRAPPAAAALPHSGRGAIGRCSSTVRSSRRSRRT